MSIADRMAGIGTSADKPMGREMPEGGEPEGGHHELHAHGDGTFHTVSPEGEKTEHPHIGHALMHMAMHHEPDGAHSHVHHQEDGSHTSHHGKDGEISGPHESQSLDEVKGHMAKAAGESEGHEGYGGGSPFED